MYLAAPSLNCGMWDLSSTIRDGTRGPCIGSSESQPLDHQGKSLHFLLNNELITYYIHDWIARALRAGIIAYTVLLFYTT